MVKSLKIDLKIPEIFAPLFRKELIHYREIFYGGGRGSGKTTNAVAFLALEFIKEPKTNILCLREYAKSTSNSVKAEFDAFFADYGFLDLGLEDGVLTYEIKKKSQTTLIQVKTTTIKNNLNGNKIIFAGITKHTVRALKSLKGIKYCFIDESDFLGEEEYRILKPTIRADGAQIIACFNPKSEDDYIYQLFQTPNSRRYCKKVNYTENPFFPKVLDDDRKDDLETMPYEIYKHVWLGYPLENIEGVIFSKETIAQMLREPILTYFDRELYSKVIISCDPATTNKDYSNEYGVTVLALRKLDNYVEVVADLSDNLTPEQFAETVDRAYREYQVEYVVVETNQGGDFIKHTIIAKNPTIPIKEVRAVSDKVNRATPVANVASQGKVLLRNENREKLVRQAKRLTNKGYLGVRGESPDRLDSMGWGVYDLFGISEYGTQGTIFNSKNVYNDLPKRVVKYSNVCYCLINAEYFAILIFDISYNGEEYFLEFKHALKGATIDIERVFQECRDKNLINIIRFPNTQIHNNIAPRIANGLNFGYYTKAGKTLDEQVQMIAPHLKGYVDISKTEDFEYSGFKRNWLRHDLFNYRVGEKLQDNECILVECFCDIITIEKNLIT